MATESQGDVAIGLYNSLASSYDDSWHSSFTKRFASYVSLSPGQQVLELVCGIDPLIFLEADAVGSDGLVIGVDRKYTHVEFYEGDILKLENIRTLKGKTFDVITLASALVLLPDPKAAVKCWMKYLKPGGIIAVDATHPNNLASGMVLEKTRKRLGFPIPYNREWSKSEHTFRNALEAAGLEAQQVFTVEDQARYKKRSYDAPQTNELFEKNAIAKLIFREEWEKLAVDGKVEEVDAVFLGIARKPLERNKNMLFAGATPTDITICHCAACRRLSGSAFLPFIDVPTASVSFIASSTLQKLKLSDAADRTFCFRCGAPITMVYLFEPENTGLTMGSIEEQSLKCDMLKVRRHIFLKENAPWVLLPDDGADRLETAPFADKVVPYPTSSA
ncbi:S-adenosyl-L-methionine-dependent methyltransferase [Zopfia rhizophila CBS 207.26]|uniref:S-adenosyl-L-methionine-dependent methyltransferase n=1 Tax=Zopfia rhizophila CBS 207.26 TaxID=1314779 RepID=A0A6A6DB76_9PEZI|nr:S-adenosyl-L-methionine-dependent methyltransferase [Zopfia rhizophila CBS 207.26]